ncbi:sigma factor-like helix-turn-helix DNA-binding protein, partial [Acinetobacter baumannii]
AVIHPVQLDEISDDEILLHEKIPDVNALSGDEVAHKKEMTHILQSAIDRLPRQEQVVLALYYYEDLVLKDISKVLKV